MVKKVIKMFKTDYYMLTFWFLFLYGLIGYLVIGSLNYFVDNRFNLSRGDEIVVMLVSINCTMATMFSKIRKTIISNYWKHSKEIDKLRNLRRRV